MNNFFASYFGKRKKKVMIPRADTGGMKLMIVGTLEIGSILLIIILDNNVSRDTKLFLLFEAVVYL